MMRQMFKVGESTQPRKPFLETEDFKAICQHTIMTNSFKQFRKLSYDDLTEWAGSRIVSRGRGYQKQGRVDDLSITSDGGLLSWVDGTRTYATHIFFSENGQLGSVCSCPYGSRCKHAVATILEYLFHVEDGRKIPTADEDDERLYLVEESDEDDEIDSPDDPDTSSLALLDTFLEKKTRSQLADLLRNMALNHPAVMAELLESFRIATGDVAYLLKRVRKEIRGISQEPGWGNYWSDDRYTPDYSGIRRTLRTLLDNGHADVVLTAGEDLLKFGVRHVEESNDEGETYDEVASSLEIIAKALERSSLSPEDKLLWAINAMSDDDLGICNVFQRCLQESHPVEAWDRVADALLARLRKGESPTPGSKYKRRHLVEMAVYALKRAGRDKELIPLYASEAPISQDYERLVDSLMHEGMIGEAEKWIHDGIQATKQDSPGIASKLREKLVHIRTMQEDWEAVIAMRVENFSGSPSVQTYEACKTACDHLGLWAQTRLCLLESLEKATLPWVMQAWPFENRSLSSTDSRRIDTGRRSDILIELAIHENDPERVLALYDNRPKQSGFLVHRRENEIAQAVRDYAPERAVRLWQILAEQLIAQVNVGAYEEAAIYLRKAAKVMNEQGQQKIWGKYLAALRTEHKRKRRFVEILDSLDGRPILKTGR